MLEVLARSGLLDLMVRLVPLSSLSKLFQIQSDVRIHSPNGETLSFLASPKT